ncbi:WhiB family transcriptional regulator [Streptomyces sp. NBC_01216]|nr:WhiB family transcriptional regulator [Streptomyces sp. NBC_01216]
MHPPEAPETDDWRAAAACVGLSPLIVFARREDEARPALTACGRCPVARRCEEVVAPADSYFDGVSAGRLWRNGRPVRARRKDVARSRASEQSERTGHQA